MKAVYVIAVLVLTCLVLAAGCGSKTKVATFESIQQVSENGQPYVYSGYISITFDNGSEGCAQCDQTTAMQLKPSQKIVVGPDPSLKDSGPTEHWAFVRLAE